MQRKHKIRGAALALAALAALAVTSAAPAGGGATVTIRHQMRGCHSWSFNSGPFKASQSVTVKAGTVLRFTNNDVMPHKLVQAAGPKMRLGASEHDQDGIVGDGKADAEGPLPLHDQGRRGLCLGRFDEDGRRGQRAPSDGAGEVGSPVHAFEVAAVRAAPRPAGVRDRPRVRRPRRHRAGRAQAAENP